MNTFLKVAVTLIAALALSACATTGARGIPGDGALYVMEASEGLIDWASQGDAGHERKSAYCSATESSYSYVRYHCSAHNFGGSTTFQGQVLPPTRGIYRGPYRESYRSYGGQRYRGSYGRNHRYYDPDLYSRHEWEYGMRGDVRGSIKSRPHLRQEDKEEAERAREGEK